MRESWRWFGPNDPVTIDDIRQTGATDIVTALHHVPAGVIWSIEDIKEHQALIEDTPKGLSNLKWTVVESIPVHEDIKLGKSSSQQYISAWIQSMENLAQCGIKVICYNFMPVIDWTRTDLNFQLPSGAYALKFDQGRFAVFDLHILQRPNAELDYTQEELSAAKELFDKMNEAEIKQLTNNIIAGLPGKMTDAYGLDTFKARLLEYQGMTKDILRQNLYRFLRQVLPVAKQLGVKLAIHPDDPPRDMLGLPRIICTADDLNRLFTDLPCEANGITLCVGTYSSRPDNNLPQMATDFAERIHFTHLRGVSRDPNEQRTFYEDTHLGSDVDMVAVIKNLLDAERRFPDKTIYMRPDHGHQMMDDIHKDVNPGYSGIGRLKGLAEIRGVIKAFTHSETDHA